MDEWDSHGANVQRAIRPPWSQFISNGDYSSPNEDRLLGQRVVLRFGNQERRGTLQLIRAATRGNRTIAVVWYVNRASNGKRVRRDQPIWLLREKPFTLELDLGVADVI